MLAPAFDDPALADRKDAMANLQDFLQIRGNDQHALATGGDIADEPVDFLLGTHVHALRRLVEQKNVSRSGQPFRHNKLLLVAAGKRTGRPKRT